MENDGRGSVMAATLRARLGSRLDKPCRLSPAGSAAAPARSECPARSPQRVPIMSPSSGVRPMVVSTLRPPCGRNGVQRTK